MAQTSDLGIKLHYACVIVISLLFIASAAFKLVDLDSFYHSVLSFKVVDGNLAKLTVYTIPPLEIICGASLLLPALRRGSALILSGLLIAFTLLIADAWMRGIDVSCGCFGSADADFSAAKAIIRDIAMFTATAWIYVSSPKCQT